MVSKKWSGDFLENGCIDFDWISTLHGIYCSKWNRIGDTVRIVMAGALETPVRNASFIENGMNSRMEFIIVSYLRVHDNYYEIFI
jgi:hypothetical protein